jgi:chromosome segregation ATPase
MLSDMVARLEKEHAEEASHKAYCDKETKETKTKMGELKYDIEKFSGKLDKSKSDSARLKDEVAELQRELAEITRSQTEADANRQEEHKTFLKFKTDLEQGLEGVRMALKVLRDYYANAESSLVQEPSDDGSFVQQPERPGGHSKKSGAGNGVINMLEVVESDFGKNLADIEMEEDTLASEYEKLTMDNKFSKQLKEKDVKYKTKEAANLDKAITELATDLASTQSELDAVLEYSSKIRGMCELKPDTYESRAARRQAEIDGLKAAIEALEGDGAAFLQQKQHALLRGISPHVGA